MAALDIRLLLLDVDGVMTDGSIVIDSDGKEFKRFHVRDGTGIVAWQKLGYQIGLITGRPSRITTLRAAELGIELIEQGHAMAKVMAYENILTRSGFADDQVAYLGDDLADLPVLCRVKYPMAVADAIEEVRDVAKYTTQNPGGRGAVREAIEHLLKAMNRWDEVLEQYRM